MSEDDWITAIVALAITWNYFQSVKLNSVAAIFVANFKSFVVASIPFEQAKLVEDLASLALRSFSLVQFVEITRQFVVFAIAGFNCCSCLASFEVAGIAVALAKAKFKCHSSYFEASFVV